MEEVTAYGLHMLFSKLSLCTALKISHQNNELLLVHDKRRLVSYWPAAFQFEILMTTFVELSVVDGRSRTWTGRPQPVSRRPMLIHPCRAHAAPPAVLCRGFEKSLSERHCRSTAGARHGHGVVCVNQTRPHCVNQMGKTQSKPLATRHDRGTAWTGYVICELTLNVLQQKGFPKGFAFL